MTFWPNQLSRTGQPCSLFLDEATGQGPSVGAGHVGALPHCFEDPPDWVAQAVPRNRVKDWPSSLALPLASVWLTEAPNLLSLCVWPVGGEGWCGWEGGSAPTRSCRNSK